MRHPHDVPTLSDGDGQDRVSIRAHRPEDAPGSLEQCHDPLSRRWTTVPLEYSLDDAKRFVTQARPGGWVTDEEWGFAVEAVDDAGVPRYAGTISLRNHGDRRAELAYGSHPWVRGRGVMERALRMLLTWGFEERGIETVIWWANRGNWASRKLAWRLGFTFEGAPRRWLPQRGELLDSWVGTLLAGEPMQPAAPWYDVPRLVGDGLVLRRHTDGRGRGLAPRMCRLALRPAFVPEADGGLGLGRVRAVAAEGNTTSRRVLELSGLQQQGRERRLVLTRSGLADGAVYDILAEDFRPSKNGAAEH